MRRLLCIAACVFCTWQTGCAMFKDGKDTAKSTAKTFMPKNGGYRDDNTKGNYNDEWAGVGKEARGNQRPQKISDGLTNWIDSPKAQAIDRSLGYE